MKFWLARRYGRKWIAKRILQGSLSQIAFALLAFFIYKAVNWGGISLDGEFLGVFVFVLLSFGSIITTYLTSKKEYTQAKIAWVTILMNEFVEDRDRHGYGVIASLPWYQRIETCEKIINSLEAKM